MMRQKETGIVEHQEVLSRLYEQIREFIFDVPLREEQEAIKDIADTNISQWLNADQTQSGKFREKDEQLLRALHTGLMSGTIVLDGVDAIDSFGYLFNIGFWRIPQVVEFYAQSGGLLELIEFSREHHNKRLWTSGDSAESLVDLLAFRLLRLYRFDSEHDSATKMPLEMRLHFAGFFDEVSEEEKARERAQIREGKSAGNLYQDEQRRKMVSEKNHGIQ